MLGYLSVDIICSEKQTVLRDCSSRKTVSFKEQIMSKDKYLNTFSKMEAIMFIILQILFARHAVFKIGEYSWKFHSFGWGVFGHVTCLDQLGVSKNIWCIIRADNVFPWMNTIASFDQFKPVRIKRGFKWWTKRWSLIQLSVLWTITSEILSS